MSTNTSEEDRNLFDEHATPLPAEVIQELEQTEDTREQLLILLTHFTGEETNILEGAQKVSEFLKAKGISVSVSDILDTVDIRRELRSVDHAPQDTPSNIVRSLEEPANAIRRTSRFGSKTILNDPSKQTGRNDPCPCGSGKKFKKCCGAAK